MNLSMRVLTGVFLLSTLFADDIQVRAEIVINEIAYHPISDSSAEEYIELYNTGPDTVDLSGWQFTDGISYEFPPGSALEKDEYLVVAKDPVALAALFPSLSGMFGPYSGQLNNGGERVRLEDALGRVRDSVEYDDALAWPTAPDGEGPSLELRHPFLDNSRPESWAASDLTDDASAAWLSFSTTFRGLPGDLFLFFTDPDGAGWIGDGESVHVLFDEIALEDLSAIEENLIVDGNFESGEASSWSATQGKQALCASLEDSFSGRYCLHYWALDTGTPPEIFPVHYHPSSPLHLSWMRTYRFRCRYQVIHGRALMAVGVGSNFVSEPALLTKRSSWGTPGKSNSSWGLPQTPLLVTLNDVGDQMIPGTSQEVVAAFNESAWIEAVSLWYSSQQIFFSATEPVNTPDQMVWHRRIMVPGPVSGKQAYRASIPSQTGNTIVRYHISWTEFGGKTHRYPHVGSHPENLVAYVPGPTPDHGVPNYFLHLVPQYYELFKDMVGSWNELKHNRPTFPATVVDLTEGRAYEDVQWKARGSSNFRGAIRKGFRTGLSLRFRPGFLYNGNKREVSISNNYFVRSEAGVQARLAHETFRRAGVPVSRTRYVWVTQNSQPLGLMTDIETPDNEFLARWGRSGEGSLYKARLYSTYSTASYGDLHYANESIYPTYEDYTRGYLKKNRRDSNHSDLIAMIEGLNRPELSGRVFDMETNGSDILGQHGFFVHNIAVDNLIARYSVDFVLMNFDRGLFNHLLYQHVSNRGLWETYPWDLDLTWNQGFWAALWLGLGRFEPDGTLVKDPLRGADRSPEPLFTRLMAIQAFRESYLLKTRVSLKSAFSERQLFEMLDRYADEGRAAFHEDITLWGFRVENQAIRYCIQNGLPTDEPMDCAVAWFKDHVKKCRQIAIWRVRNDNLDGIPISPVLSDGRTEPLVPTSVDPVTFCVNAISAGTDELDEGVDTVTFHYRLDSGDLHSQHMQKRTDVSHDGDYFLQIAAQPDGASIEYWFEMVDDLGLTDSLPETGSLFTEVVDDPTSAASLVTINEIMYHSDLLGNEWVEIQNASDRTVDVSRWLLGDSSEEHRYRLPVDISLAPGELLVIAANEFVVREAYGIDNVVGDFEFNLGNGGDAVHLFDESGESIDSVAYSDEAPWPETADGFGPSLELLDPSFDNADPSAWAASVELRGTPGRPNRISSSPALVFINECSYDPTDQGVTNDYNNDGIGDSAEDEFVELYNATDSPVDISGWTLEDNSVTSDNTFTFPEGTVIPGLGYLVVFGGGAPTGFGVDTFTGLPRLGNDGDQVRLSSGLKMIDSISFGDRASGALVNLPITADGGVIARETDGSPIFEARTPEFATPGESNNLFFPPSADLNGDSVIDHLDLLEFLGQYRSQEEGKPPGSADLNLDDWIDDWDLFLFQSEWEPSAPER